MVKYGIVCIMKITITIPDYVYKKLESDRGSIPRSTWIQKLIITSIKAPAFMEEMYGVSITDCMTKAQKIEDDEIAKLPEVVLTEDNLEDVSVDMKELKASIKKETPLISKGVKPWGGSMFKENKLSKKK